MASMDTCFMDAHRAEVEKHAEAIKWATCGGKSEEGQQCVADMMGGINPEDKLATSLGAIDHVVSGLETNLKESREYFRRTGLAPQRIEKLEEIGGDMMLMCNTICREINPRVVTMCGNLKTAVVCLQVASGEAAKPSPDGSKLTLMLEQANGRFLMGKMTPELNHKMQQVQEMCDSLMAKVKAEVEVLSALEKEQLESIAKANVDKMQLQAQMKKAAKSAMWGFLGSVGIAILATTVAVGVTIATGGAAAPILGFVGAHIAYVAGGAVLVGAGYGVGKSFCEWMRPVDDSKLSEIEAAKERAEGVQKGAEMLRERYESLQVNIRETEAHTGTLMSILGMADVHAVEALKDLQMAQAVPDMLLQLSLTQPEFFQSWTSRICKLEKSNEELFETCVNLVHQFTLDPAFHEKAKSAKATVVPQ